MNAKEYHNALGGLAKDHGLAGNLQHAAMGIASEGGELIDAWKAAVYYDKPLDLVNVVEEAGDLLFYLDLGLSQFGLTIEDAMVGNVAKLRCRYGAEWSRDRALVRDKQAEREAMAMAVYGIPDGKVPKPRLGAYAQDSAREVATEDGGHAD